MYFKNLAMARFSKESAELLRAMAADGSLQEHLASCALKPVGPLELHSTGFVPPLGEGTEAYFHAVGDFIWLAVGSETRLLPPAVIGREMAKRMAQIEEQEGRQLGARARRQLKETITTELLPKSHVNPGRTNAFLDLASCQIYVDTASRKAFEGYISEIRRALGSFPALPLNAEVAPRSILTGWIAGEPLPEGLALGDECELKDPIDKGAVVKCQRQDLQGEEIAKHLESAKQVTRLALTADDRMSFVLGEDLIIRKFKLLDGAIETLENNEDQDLQAELDARFVLMTGEARSLLSRLETALKITSAG